MTDAWPWDAETLPAHHAAHVRFQVRDGLRQPLGLLHGGIYSAVAETVASVATIRMVWHDGLTGSGLSNSASFLRPATAGVVDVTARCLHHDEREWVWTHAFRDEAQRLCALVTVTIAVRPAARDPRAAQPRAIPGGRGGNRSSIFRSSDR